MEIFKADTHNFRGCRTNRLFKKTINCWVNEGKLQNVLLPQNRAIPIECLIDYYLADGQRSRKKSPKHLRLLKKYYEEQADRIVE